MKSDKKHLKSIASKLFSNKAFNSTHKDDENIKNIKESMAKDLPKK